MSDRIIRAYLAVSPAVSIAIFAALTVAAVVEIAALLKGGAV